MKNSCEYYFPVYKALLLMLLILLSAFIGGCGGGGGGGGGGDSDGGNPLPPPPPPPAKEQGILSTITATTVPTLASQLQTQFPAHISANDVADLSEYILTQKEANPTASNASGFFEGRWLAYGYAAGTCYTVNSTPYNENCGKLLASKGESITSPLGDLTLSGSSTTEQNAGTFFATDLTNGTRSAGSFKVYVGYKTPQVSNGITSTPFALVIVGDVSGASTISYSDVKFFSGTMTTSSNGQVIALTCSSFNSQPPRPTIFGRYKQIILKVYDPTAASAAGLQLDYDAAWTPSGQGSVASAPTACTATNTVAAPIISTPPTMEMTCNGRNGAGTRLSFYQTLSYQINTTTAKASNTTQFTYGVQYKDNEVSSNSYTGSLRTTIWALTSSYGGGDISGQIVGRYTPNFVGAGARSSNQIYNHYLFSNIVGTDSRNNPNAGTYCIIATLEEFSGSCAVE